MFQKNHHSRANLIEFDQLPIFGIVSILNVPFIAIILRVFYCPEGVNRHYELVSL